MQLREHNRAKENLAHGQEKHSEPAADQLFGAEE